MTDKTDRQTRVEKPAKSRIKCTFCGKTQDEVAKVIARPSVFICNDCVEICNVVLQDAKVMVEPKPTHIQPVGSLDPRLENPKLNFTQDCQKCSFCAKSPKQIDGFVGDEEVCICNECVGLCNEILSEELF